MDKFSRKKRSEIMSKIRSSNTKFEKRFTGELKKRIGEKFKVNVRGIEGKPDIVFEKQRVCVFLDSDFWHGWQYPKWERLLKNDFWRAKIASNRKRDLRTTRHLKNNGWKVLRFWGHQIKNNPQKAINKIGGIVKKGKAIFH